MKIQVRGAKKAVVRIRQSTLDRLNTIKDKSKEYGCFISISELVQSILDDADMNEIEKLVIKACKLRVGVD